MWRVARWIRLGGAPEEACCDVERQERLTQQLGETWRIELEDIGPAGSFSLHCICGSVSYLFEAMLADSTGG